MKVREGVCVWGKDLQLGRCSVFILLLQKCFNLIFNCSV